MCATPGMVRIGLTLLLLAAAAWAGERECVFCDHGMVRLAGAEAGTAHYVCRFCSAALHVHADGQATGSVRVDGRRRPFRIVGGHPVALPGHPLVIGSHPVNRPSHPVPRPSHAVTLPNHAFRRPEHPVTRPGHPVERPAHAITLPGRAVNRPAHPVGLPGHAVTRSNHPVLRPRHPVLRPGAKPVAPRAERAPRHNRRVRAVVRASAPRTRYAQPVVRSKPPRRARAFRG